MIPLNISEGKNTACESIMAVGWLFADTPINSPNATLQNRKANSTQAKPPMFCGASAPKRAGADAAMIMAAIPRCIKALIPILNSTETPGMPLTR